MRKSIISFLVMVIVVGLLIGCNNGGIFGCDDCNDEYNDAVANYGPGDCSSVEWSDGTWCIDCWWWDLGVNHTFCQWDSCECDVTTYTFAPIYSLSGNLAEQDVIEFQAEDMDIRFGAVKQFHDGPIIPFAVSVSLTETPTVIVTSVNGFYNCHVDYTTHDSGITTGIIYLLHDEDVNMINFNGYEIQYTLN